MSEISIASLLQDFKRNQEKWKLETLQNAMYRAENLKLQSTITAQAQQINELKTDADFWFDQACAFMPASTMPKMSIQGQEHTALMNDIEKSTRD